MLPTITSRALPAFHLHADAPFICPLLLLSHPSRAFLEWGLQLDLFFLLVAGYESARWDTTRYKPWSPTYTPIVGQRALEGPGTWVLHPYVVDCHLLVVVENVWDFGEQPRAKQEAFFTVSAVLGSSLVACHCSSEVTRGDQSSCSWAQHLWHHHFVGSKTICSGLDNYRRHVQDCSRKATGALRTGAFYACPPRLLDGKHSEQH